MFNNVYMQATDVQYVNMLRCSCKNCYNVILTNQYHTGHEIHVWYKNEKYQQPVQLKLNAYADFFH